VAHVLAIESDHRQATILKRIVREMVKADLVLVDSRDAAIAAIDSRIPDVILVTALLSPRDEEELMTHLRALEGAEHLQTHTIPQLAGSRIEPDSGSGGGGLLGKFRKKKEVEPVSGCDPELFAEEIRSFIARAAQMKNEAVASLRNRVAQLEAQADEPFAGRSWSARGGKSEAATPAAETPDAARAESSWSSPFEWRRSEAPSILTRSEEPATPVTPSPSPLITSVPLAVQAAEEENRAAEEQRQAERRQMEEAHARLEAAAAAERQRAEQFQIEADQQKREADRARADAEAQATAAAARAREEERKRAEAETAAVTARAREEERKKAEAAAKVVAEKAREEERKRLEAEAKIAAQRAREEERKKAEAEAAAAAARAREEERKKAEAAAKAAAEKAREEERKRLEAEARGAKAAADKARE
jgi:hypothetical protein